MKHTKGKWERSVNYMKGSDFQDKDINEGIIDVNNHVIVKVYGNNGEEIRANTNLIASAPEMLEMLKQLRFDLNKDDYYKNHVADIDTIIAKAEDK